LAFKIPAGALWADFAFSLVVRIKDDSEEPLENQPFEWADEDREVEDREPNLGETEEDTSEL
jgi:hypothetical protein